MDNLTKITDIDTLTEMMFTKGIPYCDFERIVRRRNELILKEKQFGFAKDDEQPIKFVVR